MRLSKALAHVAWSASVAVVLLTATGTFTQSQNLVLGLSFDEGNGPIAGDVSGNSNTGTISGASWTTEGKFGSALSFDGVNDWVTVADANTLDLTTGMTLEAWLYPTASGGGSWRNVVIKERTGGEIYNLYANAETDAPVAYIVRAAQPNAPLEARGTTQLPLNTWTHVAATYDGATLRLYVNGLQVGSRAVTGALLTSTGALRIGGNSLWGEFFAGRVDEIRLYNRALAQSEIQADMTTPLGATPADITPPTLSNGQPSGSLPPGTTQATLSLNTNESATCRYATTPGVAYGSMTNVFATTGGSAHSTSVTGLTNGASYAYRVRCQDVAGNPTTTDFTINFSVALTADTVPPAVAMSAPSNGATIAGIVPVAASASDNVGVVAVQFLLNGANFGAEDTTSPYSMSWDTTTVPGGSYTLSARARDAAGNMTTSAPIGVAVANTPTSADFNDEVVIGTGLMFPTAFEFLPDGRMLIAEFGGKLLMVQPGATSVDPVPVLQLVNTFSEEVTGGGERGLVNVVADPNFTANGYIYIFYTAATPQRDRVSRFTLIGNTASLASELVVWQAIANSTSPDHHGGGLAFGPDGKLYISTGDNGNPPSCQPLTGDHGKVLRVNTDGTVPTDNPFFDGTGPNIDAIWARGLRNPYRISFDSANGRMYIGDVGFNSVEELNVGVAGANYGWPTCEGSCGVAGMTQPIFTYPHSGRDAAITGGFVYRGNGGPRGLVASYGFNEGTDASVADASGHGLTGAISGAAWTTTGKFGNALSFDGIDDLVTIADPTSALDLTFGMTLEAWVFPTALGNNWRNVLIKERPDGENYNLYANVDTPVPGVFITRASVPAPIDTRGSAQLAINSWSHLAATYDGATLRLFVNGTQVGSRAAPGKLDVSDGALRIGGNSLWGEFFAGRIDEVRVYNRGLSAAEIQSDMNLPVSVPAMSAGAFPSSFQGIYFHGDFAQNVIRYLTINTLGAVTSSAPFLPADGSPDGPYDPVMLKQGPDGALYYADFGWGWQSTANPAAIRRIRYNDGDQPPVVAVAASPLGGQAPLTVNFSSAGSVDPEDQPLSYSWSFGDGTTSSIPNPIYEYLQPGAYNARLTLSDGANTTVSEFLTIAVGTSPVATITSPVNGLTFRAADVISFAGTGTDAEDGVLGAPAFTWTILFHHDSHVHPALGPLLGSKTGTFTIPSSGHDFGGNTSYEIVLTVTDSHGLQHTTSILIVPQKANLTFLTNPAGLTVTIDGISTATPYVKDALVGFQYAVDAPSQIQGSVSYTFSSWSDGGGQSHSITVPASGQSFTATFQTSGPPPLPPGLVAGYGFNEGSGTTSQDVTTNNLTATISGAGWTTAGRFGNALSFDGISDLVTVADANVLDLTTGMTIETWVFPTALGTSWRNVLIKERPNGEVYNLYANVDTGIPRVYVARASAPAVPLDAQGMAQLPVNTWTHLAATYDGSTLRLYVNGVQVGSRAVTGALVASTGALRIGGNSIWGEHFQGLIDEVRIYNRALSAAEIQTDMSTPLQRP